MSRLGTDEHAADVDATRTPPSWHVGLLLVAITVIQFVDVGLVGGLVEGLSAQKLLAGVAYGIYVLGRRPTALDPRMVVLAGLLALGYVVGALANGDVPIRDVATSLVLLVLAAAVSMHYALELRDPRARRWAVTTWQLAGVTTGAIAVGQYFGTVPLVTVPVGVRADRVVLGEVSRATGLKFDPNFAAAIWLVALVIVLWGARRHRMASASVLVAAIFATGSRMGLLGVLVVAAAGIAWPPETRGVRLSGPHRRIVGTSLVALALIGSVSVLGEQVYSTSVERAREVLAALSGSGGNEGSPNPTSAETRAQLLREGWSVAVTNFPEGLGPGQAEVALAAVTRKRNAVHNTFIELAIVGGAAGALVAASLAWAVLGSLWRGARGGRGDLWALAGVVALVMSLLTLTTDMLFFLLPALLWDLRSGGTG